MKNRSYESLVAGMRERPTIFDAEVVLKKDYPLKLPDRRAITLWNTPEISQFRGVQEALDDEEERRNNAQLEQLELHKVARETETSVPDMTFVVDELRRGRQSAGAVSEAMAAQQATHEQALRGMQAETQAQMARLAAEAAGAAKRQELAAVALSDLRDMHTEHRSALGAIAEQMGRPSPVQLDQSVTNYTTTNVSQVDERSVHNIAMQVLNHGAAQFGEAMAQNRQGQEQTMAALMDYARTHQQQHNHLHLSIAQPDEQMMQLVSSGPPPPPAPGAGAVRRGRSRRPPGPYEATAGAPSAPPPPAPPAAPALPALPAPAPEAAPTVPAPTVQYRGRTRTPAQPRARTRTPAQPRARSRAPPAKPSMAPAEAGDAAATVPKPSAAPEALLPKPSIAPPKPSEATARPSAAPPKPSRTRAKSKPIVPWTTGEAPAEAMLPKRARTSEPGVGKGRGAAKAKAKAATGSGKGRGAARVDTAAIAAAVGKDAEQPLVAKPKRATRNKVPAAAPPVKKKETVIKKVAIDKPAAKEGALKKAAPRRNKGIVG